MSGINRVLFIITLAIVVGSCHSEQHHHQVDVPTTAPRDIFFGDVHSHTVASTDATALDTFTTVEEQFAFARGSVSVAYNGELVYRGGNTSGFPYGYTQARSVHDLIRLVDQECNRKTDCDYLLIDHHPIQSKGTRFSMATTCHRHRSGSPT